MFHSKVRYARSKSIIDISSKNSSNQNQIQLCHSYSNDSLDKEFLENTKQTIDKLFLRTNFNEILHQIQYTLQPIVEQLRQQIQRKRFLSKQDRFVCMKSCAKFITETLIHEQWDLNHNDFIELYQLQKVLNRFLSKQQIDISTQTSEQLEIELMKLQVDNKSKPHRMSYLTTDEHHIHSNDPLIRQKLYHKSVSRAFKKLNADLQKLNHETPFQAHLSKYHKHNHS